MLALLIIANTVANVARLQGSTMALQGDVDEKDNFQQQGAIVPPRAGGDCRREKGQQCTCTACTVSRPHGTESSCAPTVGSQSSVWEERRGPRPEVVVNHLLVL
mmetsp:Transcript_35937/g.113683  ORF Transcript_35937/g.113683 Transcript_35937/m.113683 type:complete len:104 (+) Transcript_35937:158-469(+)